MSPAPSGVHSLREEAGHSIKFVISIIQVYLEVQRRGVWRRPLFVGQGWWGDREAGAEEGMFGWSGED